LFYKEFFKVKLTIVQNWLWDKHVTTGRVNQVSDPLKDLLLYVSKNKLSTRLRG